MEEKPVCWKKKPAHCFESSRESCILLAGYILRFHLTSDWSRNNNINIPEIFSGVHGFIGKTVSL